MLLDMVNQNIKEALKKFQDDKTQEYQQTQKQINEIVEVLNKHQTETKMTMSREINELRQKLTIFKKK
jgi:hypothetical protein